VLISGGSNQVVNDFIGLSLQGKALGNGTSGIEVQGSSNTLSANVVSGNSGDGVLISGNSNQLQGNYVGTTHDGSAALANGQSGIEVKGNSNTIGSSAGALNVISGNSGDGVLLSGTGNQVLNDYIGTNSTVTSTVANGTNGVEVQGNNNTISSSSISGNKGDGVLISGTSNLVQSSYIGSNSNGSAAVANGTNGVEVKGSSNTIGGTTTAVRNTISGNTQDGVLVNSGSGNTIRGNIIDANGPTSTGPGIVLSSDANGSLTPPSISSAKYASNTLTVTGTFAAAATGSYVLELFANPTGDAEGKILLGSLTVKVTSTGSVPFTFSTTTSVPGTDPVITATLTDPAGNTSAFTGGVTVS
jgi:parallel beta-helix repeat protein